MSVLLGVSLLKEGLSQCSAPRQKWLEHNAGPWLREKLPSMWAGIDGKNFLRSIVQCEIYPICFLELYELEHPKVISKMLQKPAVISFALKVMPVVHQTITWARCQTDGTTRTVVAPSMGQRGACSEGARTGVMAETAGACQTDGDLTPISMMTLIDQTTSVMISIPIRDLAIGYENSRGEEAHHCKMRNGDEVDLGLPFLLITGNLKEVVQTVGLLVLGKDGDLQMTDIHGILRMHASEEGGMRGKNKSISLSWVKG